MCCFTLHYFDPSVYNAFDINILIMLIQKNYLSNVLLFKKKRFLHSEMAILLPL